MAQVHPPAARASQRSLRRAASTGGTLRRGSRRASGVGGRPRERRDSTFLEAIALALRAPATDDEAERQERQEEERPETHKEKIARLLKVYLNEVKGPVGVNDRSGLPAHVKAVMEQKMQDEGAGVTDVLEMFYESSKVRRRRA